MSAILGLVFVVPLLAFLIPVFIALAFIMVGAFGKGGVLYTLLRRKR